MALHARRAKNRDKIVCGACGEALGLRYDPSQYEDDQMQWHVRLSSGWTRRDDGVWVRSGHARRSIKRGRVLGPDGKPKAYRPSASSPPGQGLKRYQSRWPDSPRVPPQPGFLTNDLEGDRRIPRHSGFLLTELPVEIVCPRSKCGMRQILDPVRLEVTAAPSWLENDGYISGVRSQIPGAILFPDSSQTMKAFQSGHSRAMDRLLDEASSRSSPLAKRKPPVP